MYGGALILALGLGVSQLPTHDSGTPFAEWMMSLKQPAHPTVSCCGPADQFYVREYKPSNKPGYAFTATVIGHGETADFEIDVPDHAVLWNHPNPTGRGVIFVMINEYAGAYVLCFVPGMGT